MRNERRIREEVGHHLDELRAQLEAQGMPPEEAQREARRRFGDPERVARATGEAGRRGGRGLPSGLRGDLVQALRGLRRSPVFTGSIVVTLALALGSSIAVFAVVWDVLLRPLDLRDPDSLVVLLERPPGSLEPSSPTSEGTFHDWRRDLTTVRDLVAWEWVSRTLEDPERPEELVTVQVSGDAFEVLGIPPLLGRSLRANDQGDEATPPRAVMISQGLWTRRFGSDPGVVGRRIPVDGADREIVGVVPDDLDLFGDAAELFEPWPHVPDDPTNRGGRFLEVVGRLAPGATVAAADAEVAAFTERIAETYPTSARGWSAGVRTLSEHLLGDARPRLAVAAAGVGLLLLVAVVNVAHLLIVRASDASREMAIRAALGAGRHRLVRLRMVESLLLGLAGGAGGLALAASLRRWLAAAHGDALPRALGTGLPDVALVGGAVLAAALGLSIGAAPAVRAADRALGGLGRGDPGGGRAPATGRQALVVVQVGLTVVLLVGAGLLVRTVSAVRAVDLGFGADGVVAARTSVDAERYASRDAQRAYYRALLERVRAIAGVEAAGLTSALPMDPVAINFDLPTRTDPSASWEEALQADFRIVSPGLMEALDFRVLEGRFFGASDASEPLVAVVNRSLAERLWPGESAVGKRIQNVWRQDDFAEVVGVVEDTRFYGPVEAPRPELFMPLSQVGWDLMTLTVRGSGDPSELRAALERAFLDVDPLLPPVDLFEVGELLEASTAAERLYSSLLLGFATLSLALATAGVYGVVAWAARRRRREMGVRLALGAGRADVTGLVVRSGLGVAALGVAVGLVAAIPATRLLAGILFGVEPLDPATLGAVAALLLAVTTAASLGPALRTARLDPAQVLREE